MLLRKYLLFVIWPEQTEIIFAPKTSRICHSIDAKCYLSNSFIEMISDLVFKIRLNVARIKNDLPGSLRQKRKPRRSECRYWLYLAAESLFICLHGRLDPRCGALNITLHSSPHWLSKQGLSAPPTASILGHTSFYSSSFHFLPVLAIEIKQASINKYTALHCEDAPDLCRWY